MFSIPLTGYDTLLRAQLVPEDPNPPVPPHQGHWFSTGQAKTQQRCHWLLAQQHFHGKLAAQTVIFKAMPFQL